MNTLIANLALLFAGCVIVSVFYWEVFHVVALRALRFRLFALRDEVRRVAAERGLANTYAYRDLEKFICKTICYSPHVSLMSFAWFMARHRKKLSDDEYKRFQKEAPREFLAMRDATAKATIILMMLNSPWVIFAGSVLIPVMWAFGKISKALLYGGAEQFVEELESDSSVGEPVLC